MSRPYSEGGATGQGGVGALEGRGRGWGWILEGGDTSAGELKLAEVQIFFRKKKKNLKKQNRSFLL